MGYKEAVLADVPTLYYRLNETSGSTVADSSGNGNNGTCHGTIVSKPGALGFDADGAISFNSGFYIQLATGILTTGIASTFEAWVYGTATLQNADVPFGAPGISDLNFASGGLYRAYNGSDQIISNTYPTLGVWQHWVVTAGASSGLAIYLNGVLLVSNANTWAINFSYLGASVGNGFSGANFYLDEVAYYPHVLSAGRIAEHYLEAVSPYRAGFF